MEPIISKVMIIFLGFLGFIISFYIYVKKDSDDKLLGRSVIGSKYGKILGIPNEILGMIYYGTVILIYVLSQTFPIFQLQYVVQVVFIIIGVAFLLSIYLTVVQIFILKDFCAWCLISAIINILIFITYIF